MTPPWTWLSAVSALTTSPQSWTATIFLTRTSPVSVSTSTSANCAPAVKRFQASAWFSARSAEAETPSAGSFAQASFQPRLLPFAEKVPAENATSCGSEPHSFASSSATRRTAWYAAARMTGALEGVVVEPPDPGP